MAWSQWTALALAFSLSVPAVGGQPTLRFGAGYLEPTGRLEGAHRGSKSVGAIPAVVAVYDTEYISEAAGAVAPYLSFELPVGRRLGLEFSAEGLQGDLQFSGTQVIRSFDTFTGQEYTRSERQIGYPGRFEAYPVGVGFNYHFSPARSVDFYLGPIVGWVFPRDALFQPSPVEFPFFVDQPTELKGDYMVGAGAGVDLPLGDGAWLLNVAVRHLRAKLLQQGVPALFTDRFANPIGDPTERDLVLDPWSLRVGVGFRLGR